MRMDTTARIVSLKLKHAGIEKEINEALQCPAIRVDGMLLQTLKRSGAESFCRLRSDRNTLLIHCLYAV